MSELLRAQNLWKSYPSGEERLVVLRGVDLEVRSGDFIGIVGPSGSGKSTLLNLLGALDLPDQGEVIFQGNRLYELNDSALSRFRRTHIGFVFQFHNLLVDFTALENVMIPALMNGASPSEARDQAARLLTRLGLGKRLHHYPDQLSGGERQRVAVARALINNPSILLADEPSGNLDPENEAHLFSLLRELNEEGTTLLVVTHNEELIPYFSQVFRLKEGKLHPLPSR